MRRPPATPVPPRGCTESEEVRSFWFHSVHTTASGSLPECGVCVPKDVRALLPHPAYEVGHSQVCPPCTDGPQIAGILSHDVDQCHGRVPFTLPPAPNACAQVRLTDSGRSDMPALAAHGRAGACGARGAARPSPALWRAPMVRQKREEGGGDLGRRMWRAGGRARRRLGRRRLVNEPRSPCRGAPGGCSAHARRMVAPPPAAAAPPRTGGWAIEACAGRQLGRPGPTAGTAAASRERGAVTGTCRHRS